MSKIRHKVIILVNQGDCSLKFNNQNLSPVAESLSQKFTKSKIESKILRIDLIKNNKKDYNSLGPFFILRKLGFSTIFIWQIIFKILKPLAVIAIDWDIILNEVAKASKIKLSYIQHGVICNDHMYFGNGAIQNLSKSQFPHSFLSWDQSSANNFLNICKTFIIGNLWLTRFTTNDDTDKIVSYFKNIETTLIEPNHNNRKNILLTLTWGNPEFEFINEKLIATIKNTFDRYNWLIRVHPVYLHNEKALYNFTTRLKNSFTKLELDRIEWEKTSFLPLPIVLNQTNLHITIESSTVIEAALLGIKSLILNNKVISYSPEGLSHPPYGGPSYFQFERELGYVEIWDGSSDIQAWIDENINKVYPKLSDITLYDQEWSNYLTTISP